MKLAYCITVFNGWELLESAINSIKPFVDNVIICYQKTSNTGNFEPLNYERAKYYIGEKKVDVINFEPNLRLHTKQIEITKHQCMIDRAKMLGCSHFIMAATDHFYLEEELERAKQMVIKNNYDVTVTKMYTYYKNPEWQLTPIEDYYMPFICKLYPRTRVTNANYPVLVDPSVKVNTHDRFYEFKQDEIMMHHYSMIREDIRNKFDNAAASVNWGEDRVKLFIDEYENYNLEENKGVTYFQGRKIKVVDNYFNL